MPQPAAAAEPLQTSAGDAGSLSWSEPLRPSQGLGIRALLVLAAATCILLMLWLVPASRQDPYSRATLALSGSVDNGGRLFRINCAGCHGLAAQGLVGPNLHGVSHRRNDRQLITQVVSGRTPPMPRFQPDPQAMADLLAFLHSLPD
ncbi:MAG: c-type cytochrome [Cyanobium sp.]|jgi:mono/diheme cytochrome c family protein|nr:cytochrome c [Synechococcaceae cyanobacterium]